jgi:hypothetical protein
MIRDPAWNCFIYLSERAPKIWKERAVPRRFDEKPIKLIMPHQVKERPVKCKRRRKSLPCPLTAIGKCSAFAMKTPVLVPFEIESAAVVKTKVAHIVEQWLLVIR